MLGEVGICKGANITNADTGQSYALSTKLFLNSFDCFFVVLPTYKLSGTVCVAITIGPPLS